MVAVSSMWRQSLEHLAKSRLWQLNLAHKGIAPVLFRTKANAEMDTYPDVIHWVDLLEPLKRWGGPLEITSPAIFLASLATSYVYDKF